MKNEWRKESKISILLKYNLSILDYLKLKLLELAKLIWFALCYIFLNKNDELNNSLRMNF